MGQEEASWWSSLFSCNEPLLCVETTERKEKLIVEAFEEEEVALTMNPRIYRQQAEQEEHNMIAAARAATAAKRGGKHRTKSKAHSASGHKLRKPTKKNTEEHHDDDVDSEIKAEFAHEVEEVHETKKVKKRSSRSSIQLGIAALTAKKQSGLESTATVEWELIDSLIPVPNAGELRKIFVQRLDHLGKSSALFAHDDKGRHLLYRAVEKKDVYAARAIMDAAYHNSHDPQHFLEWIDLPDSSEHTAYELANLKKLSSLVEVIDAKRKEALHDIEYSHKTHKHHHEAEEAKKPVRRKTFSFMSTAPPPTSETTTNKPQYHTQDSNDSDIHVKPTASHILHESLAGQAVHAVMDSVGSPGAHTAKRRRQPALNNKFNV